MSPAQTPPAKNGQGGRTPHSAGLLTKESATFLALIACPLLALVCAVFGLILVIQGKFFVGLLFLLLLTQVFAIGGLVVWTRRRRPQG